MSLINEFKKVLFSKILILLLLGIIISIVAITFNYKNQSNYNNSINGITKYKNTEELIVLKERVELEIKSLKDSGEEFDENETKLEELEELNQLYQLLLDNNYEHEDIGQTDFLKKDKIDYLITVSVILFLLIFIVLVSLATLIINYELDEGIYKFVYSGIENRKKIILNKFIVYIATFVFLLLIAFLLMNYFSNDYNPSYKFILLKNENGFETIKVSDYIAKIYLSHISIYIFYSICIFSFNLFFKKIITTLIACVILFSILQTLFILSGIKFLVAFANFPLFMANQGVDQVTFMTVSTIKYILVVIFAVFSVYKFEKRDL